MVYGLAYGKEAGDELGRMVAEGIREIGMRHETGRAPPGEVPERISHVGVEVEQRRADAGGRTRTSRRDNRRCATGDDEHTYSKEF